MIKVFIAVPHHKQIECDGEVCRNEMLLHCLKDKIPVVLKFKGDASVSANRNFLMRCALEAEASHLLFIDDDMVFPADALSRLLAWDKDIVCAAYSKRWDGGELVGKIEDDAKPEYNNGLISMEYVGSGFILINTNVYRKINAACYYENFDPVTGDFTSEDVNFCQIARAHDYKIWADIALSKEMGHIGKKAYYLNSFP